MHNLLRHHERNILVTPHAIRIHLGIEQINDVTIVSKGCVDYLMINKDTQNIIIDISRFISRMNINDYDYTHGYIGFKFRPTFQEIRKVA